jgi:flavin-dependent dehydrogenase
MKNQKKLPIIVGTGISGLAISRKLSLEGIEHILVGSYKNVTRPILGESVEMFGVTILKSLFPELSQHFYPKLGINYQLDKSKCHFDFHRCFKIPEIIELMNKTKYTHKMEGSFSLIHLDRALFDFEAFEAVINSPHCHYINSNVEAIDYNIETDTINSITVIGGRVLYPLFVYDASSAARIVAKLLKLQPEFISDEMKVVFAHYKARPNTLSTLDPKQKPWIHNTEILRHYQYKSGFNGSSWCIPIGEYISVGTNIIGNKEMSDEEILAVTDQAYYNHGVDYRNYYQDLVAVKSMNSRLYYYPKVYGKNWVLTSGAEGLTWYTAQTGVESAMFIASIADRVLLHPNYYCQYYQEFIMQQVRMHKIHDWLHHHEVDNITDIDAYKFMINSIRCIQGRYLLGNLCLDHPILTKLEWLQDIKKYQSQLTEQELDEIVESIKRMETCAEYINPSCKITV